MKYLMKILIFLLTHKISELTELAEAVETEPKNGFRTMALTGNKTLIISACKRGDISDSGR